MFRRIMTVMVAALLLLGALVPAASLADYYDMYVYTPNGRGLNARTEPRVGDNIIKSLPFGTGVYVLYHLGNGWTQIGWGGLYDYAYVQTRFLVSEKPAKKPTPSGGKANPGDSSSTVAELNQIFKTCKLVAEPYKITVRPVRASGWANVRYAPSKKSELVSTLRANKQLLVIAELQDWYQVEDPDTGAVGYISTKFVAK